MEKEEEEKDYCDYTFEEVLNGEGFTIKDMKQFEAFKIAEDLKDSNIAEIAHWILNPNLNYYHLEDSEFAKIIEEHSLIDEEDEQIEEEEKEYFKYMNYVCYYLDELEYFRTIYKEELIEDWKKGKFTNFKLER